MEEKIPEKYCLGCEQWKPATTEYWHRNGKTLHTYCKSCRSIRKTPLPAPVPEGYKRCSHCQGVKAVTDFYQVKHTSDGLNSWCKACQIATSKVIRSEKNKVKRREKQEYMSIRPCTRCGEDDPEKFYLVNGKKKAICKKCDIEDKKAQQKANPEAARARLKKFKEANPGYYRKWAYGLSPEEYQAMFEAQFGLCAVCGEAPQDGKFHVDHCHASNVVRSLLCSRCNLMLGMAKDSSELLRKAAKYLDLHAT